METITSGEMYNCKYSLPLYEIPLAFDRGLEVETSTPFGP